jgi:hypothetical protein
MVFDMDTASAIERRNYRNGQSAYYDGISWDDLTGLKTSSKPEEYLQGWIDAQEEERLSR